MTDLRFDGADGAPRFAIVIALAVEDKMESGKFCLVACLGAGTVGFDQINRFWSVACLDIGAFNGAGLARGERRVNGGAFSV